MRARCWQASRGALPVFVDQVEEVVEGAGLALDHVQVPGELRRPPGEAGDRKEERGRYKHLNPPIGGCG